MCGDFSLIGGSDTYACGFGKWDGTTWTRLGTPELVDEHAIDGVESGDGEKLADAGNGRGEDERALFRKGVARCPAS